MSEFKEVMRNLRRMCEFHGDNLNSCDNCTLKDSLCCMLPSEFTEEFFEEVESKTNEWAKTHKEPCYPTWQEWHSETFPDGVEIGPCCFYLVKDCRNNCYECRRKSIPEEIAKKLGIKPEIRWNHE